MIIFLSLLAFLPLKSPYCLSKVKIGETNKTLSLLIYIIADFRVLLRLTEVNFSWWHKKAFQKDT